MTLGSFWHTHVLKYTQMKAETIWGTMIYISNILKVAFKNPKIAHLEKIRLVIRSDEGQNHEKWVAPSCWYSTTGLLATGFWGSVTKSLGDTRGQSLGFLRVTRLWETK